MCLVHDLIPLLWDLDSFSFFAAFLFARHSIECSGSRRGRAAQDMAVSVAVQLMSGKECVVDITPHMTVGEVKELVKVWTFLYI